MVPSMESLEAFLPFAHGALHHASERKRADAILLRLAEANLRAALRAAGREP